MSGSDIFLIVAAFLIVVFVVIPVTISVRADFKFNSVVTGSNSGHVPLELFDLASLVKVTQRHCEKECDHDAARDHSAHHIVLVMHNLFRLYTSELRVEKSIVFAFRWHFVLPE